MCRPSRNSMSTASLRFFSRIVRFMKLSHSSTRRGTGNRTLIFLLTSMTGLSRRTAHVTTLAVLTDQSRSTSFRTQDDVGLCAECLFRLGSSSHLQSACQIIPPLIQTTSTSCVAFKEPNTVQAATPTSASFVPFKQREVSRCLRGTN